MSLTPWIYWEQNFSNSQNRKRRFDDINITIECLKAELMMNDIVLINELYARINSVNDRTLMAAELYRERLEALANSSRSQIWQIQTGNLLQTEDFHLDYDSWTPKPMKYRDGYSPNYTNNQNWACNTIQIRKNTQTRKRKAPSRPITKAQASSSKRSKTKESNYGETKGPGNPNYVLGKNIAAAKSKTQTATNSKSGNTVPAVTQASVIATKGVAASTSTGVEKSVTVKTKLITKNNVSHNIPSLYSCNLSRINFDDTDKLIVKCEKDLMVPLINSAVRIKTEPGTDVEAMVDDLADRL